jgi:4a-hydroxytetrahydrobiopterin dehydratase
METLDPDRIRTALDELDGWRLDCDRLVRELEFDGFREAIAFINRVADLADAANHHPELSNVYNRVTVVLTTHDAGGVTDKDLALARDLDRAV